MKRLKTVQWRGDNWEEVRSIADKPYKLIYASQLLWDCKEGDLQIDNDGAEPVLANIGDYLSLFEDGFILVTKTDPRPQLDVAPKVVLVGIRVDDSVVATARLRGEDVKMIMIDDPPFPPDIEEKISKKLHDDTQEALKGMRDGFDI